MSKAALPFPLYFPLWFQHRSSYPQGDARFSRRTCAISWNGVPNFPREDEFHFLFSIFVLLLTFPSTVFFFFVFRRAGKAEKIQLLLAQFPSQEAPISSKLSDIPTEPGRYWILLLQCTFRLNRNVRFCFYSSRVLARPVARLVLLHEYTPQKRMTKMRE